MKLRTNLLKCSALVAACSMSFAASAAPIITNGSFENPDVAPGQWDYFSASEVNGWSGSNIEIWDHLQNEPAADGEQFAELNAHPNSGTPFLIYQDFETTIGMDYNFSFAYQARTDNAESFGVTIDSITPDIDGPIFSSLTSAAITDHTRNGWSTYNGVFTAETLWSRISFETITPSTGTYGNFIDDVKVVGATQVSEPGTLALLGLGLAGLGLTRRKTK